MYPMDQDSKRYHRENKYVADFGCLEPMFGICAAPSRFAGLTGMEEPSLSLF